MRNVVITGIGLVTPLGDTLDDVRARFLSGRTAVQLSPTSTPERLRVGAFVERDLTAGIASNQLKILDRSSLMAMQASDAVMLDAGLKPGEFDAMRIGTMLGCGAGSTVANYNTHEVMMRKDHVGAMTILKQLPNAPSSHVSMRHDLRGECTMHVVACSSASTAMGAALRAIRHGYLDQVVAGGVEAPYGESHVRAWESMRVMARVDPDNPGATCRPYSKNRTGIVLGEGCVLFMFEAEEHAKARGAKIYATFAGYGASADASHITMPAQVGQASSMRAALADAQLDVADIGYINAHGTATGPGDTVETKSVREVFGARADLTPMSASKSFHGHQLGGGAAIELLPTLFALNDGLLSPTLNLDVPDPECDLDYVPNVARTGVKMRAAMSNSFAFGGSNNTLILTN